MSENDVFVAGTFFNNLSSRNIFAPLNERRRNGVFYENYKKRIKTIEKIEQNDIIKTIVRTIGGKL